MRCITSRARLDSAELEAMVYDVIPRNPAVIGEVWGTCVPNGSTHDDPETPRSSTASLRTWSSPGSGPQQERGNR